MKASWIKKELGINVAMVIISLQPYMRKPSFNDTFKLSWFRIRQSLVIEENFFIWQVIKNYPEL